MKRTIPRVALVYDRINKFGGAERILLALHEIWPEAPVFTSVTDLAKARWAADFRVIPSFMQGVPFAAHHHELFAWLTPLAFESFGFDDYDIVISVTSAEAKNIITKPGTLHICYCLTPTRYLWSGYQEYLDHPGMGYLGPVSRRGLAFLSPRLRKWDRYGAEKPDYMVAISQMVADRIKLYYQREADAVIYPPVDTSRFRKIQKNGDLPDTGFYLTVARFVGYKRLDLLIEAFNEMNKPLWIIGRGKDQIRLESHAGKTIRFITDDLTDEELVRYYNQCLAFVFAGAEDFGLVSVEAQACGKPVITYRHSGMAETVDHMKTGVLFDTQTKQAIIEAVSRASEIRFSETDCISNARKYAKNKFKQEFETFVQTTMKEYQGRMERL